MPRLFKFADRSWMAPAHVLARLFLALSCCLALGLLAPNAAPSASAQVSGAADPRAGAPAATLVKPDGTLNLANSFSGAVNLQGWNVTLDSQRGPILARQGGASLTATTVGGNAPAPAAPSDVPQPAPFWLPLPHNGLTENPLASVNAIAVIGGDIYVGGYFTETADGAVTGLNNIARFNTDSNTWFALPHDGLDNSVFALAVSKNDLYVGGGFGQTADSAVPMTDIAKFSGGAWSALSNMGLNGPVYALAVSGSKLYAGGSFNQTQDCTFSSPNCVRNLNAIAIFNGTGWSAAPGKGLMGNVHALAVSGSDLYVGGVFGQTWGCLDQPKVGCVTDLGDIARLNGGAWFALPHRGLAGFVYAFALSGSTLYVGGTFQQTVDGFLGNLDGIARFSGGAWSAVPHNGLSLGEVHALAVNGNHLYAGGLFSQNGDGSANPLGSIAHYNIISNTWSAPPHGGLHASQVFALGVSGSDVYVGGSFNQSGDLAVANLNNIAKLTNDTDGDGIPDDWERNGVTINGVFIDLHAMGADPLHKDLFVHADWMNSAGLKPDDRDMQIVSDAFNNSPLPNPDGATGVHLHVDLGPTSVMNPVTGATWGALSKAGQLPYQATIGSTAGNAYNWGAVDTIKQTYFNPAQRAAIFHYMCFCSSLGGLDATSGIARGIPAHDFLVTLGGWPVPGGTSLQKAGTFMHELGHNLGLHHGGGDDLNFKPNFLSVMNYSFQTIGLLTPFAGHLIGTFDYSSSQLPTLDETDLSEAAGIIDPEAHRTLWNTSQLNGSCAAHPNNYFSVLADPAADWNCDGVLNAGTVQADINGDGICVGPGPNHVSDTAPSGDDLLITGNVMIAGANRTCDTAKAGDDVQLHPVGFHEVDLLTGFDDWSAVVFDAGNQIGQPPTALTGPSLLTPSDVLTTTVDEPTYQQMSDAVPPALFNAEVSAPIDVVSYSPPSGPAALAVHFDGGASTTPTGTVTSWVWDFGDSTVGAGATVTHTYTLPGTYYATLRVTNSGGFINLVALQHRVTVSELARLFLPLVRR